MRILHVYKVYLPENFTGVSRVIHTIAQKLGEVGVESHVFALCTREVERAPLHIDGHTIHLVKSEMDMASTSFSLAAFRRFGEVVKTVDLVHYHFPWPMGDLLHLVHGRGKPMVVTYHSDIVKQRALFQLYRPLMGRFLSQADAIVATSPNYLASSPVLGRYRDKTEIIPIGVDPRRPPDPGRVAAWRERLPEDFFLFVGAPRYYKGLDYLMEAARLNGLPVVVAGARREDVALAEVPESVVFLGEVGEEDKEALFELCRAFVFPSHLRSEAFGVALLEASRAGKPMISCEIGTGTSYANLDGVTGLTIPPAEPTALAEAMAALAADPERAARMGEAARRRVAEAFSADGMATRYRELYERVLAARQAET